MKVTFRTRARTVDMLGRQQIAGIPTAISELFKNAHDAYADRVEIDFYRSDGLFVLRDDGVGMSRNDFAHRWLTIGTESKFDDKHAPPIDANKPLRPMLGEKGIGRLAISTIGSQLLILTRPKVEEAEALLTVSFLNWSIFEWPRIDLDEIEIPLRIFEPGTLPSAADVAEMVEEFRVNVGRVGHRVNDHSLEKIDSELNEFNVDPKDIDSYLGEPSLRGNGSGTHFIVKPVSDLLSSDIDGDQITSKAAPLKKPTPLTKALLGFSNTMTPDAGSVIHTAFRDHPSDDESIDLIGEDEFFTPEEFENADHQICGDFDEFGQFRGEFSIYGEAIPAHVIPWGGAGGAMTKCGPFSIKFAAFEGESRNSTIPDEEYARLARKAETLGGIYIYRNGVRVLPYGNTDYDWLNIEIRRTKSAYYYYFSHRKMFGAVEIDAERNRELKEKAGREGFQENKAYRQFRSILQNFFFQAAVDFFRSDGVHANTFDQRKAELSSQDKQKKHREEQVSYKKKKFQSELEDFFAEVANRSPQEEVRALTEHIEKQLHAITGLKNVKLAASKVLDLEREAYARIRDIEAKYRVARPRIGLSKSLLREWSAYNTELSSLQENVFQPASELIEELVSEHARNARLSIGRRTRTEAALKDLEHEVRRSTGESGKIVKKEADKVASEVKEATTQALKIVESRLREVVSEFQRTDLEDMPDDQFIETRDGFENRIQKVAEEQGHLLVSIIEQLQSIDTRGEHSTIDQLVAIEQRYVLSEEEAEADTQLAQLGMAIEIINHEFAATIRSIRNGLRRLKAWANANKELEKLYESIRISFDHLDGYLTLFTPLQRRLHRKKIDIRGSNVRDFLQELFKARMARHKVTLRTTKAFANATVVGFPSSFYPVFVNLVDNAIFWLSQQNPNNERIITLDAHDGALLVSDTGPGVNVRDRDAIFDSGFTRKPGGRGMGLHIGREGLRQVGFDLHLINWEGGATFGILRMDDSQQVGKN